MDPEQTRRRIRAARAIADLTIERLAQRLGDARLGAKTLGKIERGERPVRTHELQLIALACGLPHAFFTVDFDRLPEMMMSYKAEGGRPFASTPGDADVIIEGEDGSRVAVDIKSYVDEAVQAQMERYQERFALLVHDIDQGAGTGEQVEENLAPLSDAQLRSAAELLAPLLLAGARARRQVQEREQQGTDAPDRPRAAAEGGAR